MNAIQYSNYQANVNRFLTSNNVKPGCQGPKYEEPDPRFEPFFSSRPCDCCGSHLGGDRETYQFATRAGKLFEADICTDCVYFLAYGQLDDATMMEIAAQTA